MDTREREHLDIFPNDCVLIPEFFKMLTFVFHSILQCHAVSQLRFAVHTHHPLERYQISLYMHLSPDAPFQAYCLGRLCADAIRPVLLPVHPTSYDPRSSRAQHMAKCRSVCSLPLTSSSRGADVCQSQSSTTLYAPILWSDRTNCYFPSCGIVCKSYRHDKHGRMLKADHHQTDQFSSLRLSETMYLFGSSGNANCLLVPPSPLPPNCRNGTVSMHLHPPHYFSDDHKMFVPTW